MSNARTRRTRTGGGNRPVSSRTRIVWGSLVASMTVVGGLPLALDRRESPIGDGFALPPLAAMAGAGGIESVFNTPEPMTAGRWQAIVIHDSGTASGSPDTLDEQARSMGLRGLGYHFVIGNGSGLRDGQIHVGARWLKQSAGAHAAGAKADWYNRNAIGICIVGNGERRPFTEAQTARLMQLVDALMRECKIPADRVYLHSQIADTPSPGRFFPEAGFRGQLGSGR